MRLQNAPFRSQVQVMALSSNFNWLSKFSIAKVTLLAFDSNRCTSCVHVCMNSLSVVVFYFLVPDMKGSFSLGQTLGEIDAFFLGSRNAMQPVKMANMVIADELYMRDDDRVEAEKVESA